MAKVPNPFAMSNILSTMGILAIVFNSLIVVRWGLRRNIMMTGLTVCGILQLIIAVVYDKRGPSDPAAANLLVAFTCLYMMSYNGMIASYSWLAGGEIPSQRLRSYTFGLASAAGFFFAWLTTFTAPYFINPASLNWGPKYGYIWFPSCILGVLWVFFFLPETKGRTLEEIDEMVWMLFLSRRRACSGMAANLRVYSSRHGSQLESSGVTSVLGMFTVQMKRWLRRGVLLARKMKRYEVSILC